MLSFYRRLIETARLRPSAYQEIEFDNRERTWWQPVLVVTLAGIGLGAAQLGRVTPIEALYSAAMGLTAWFLWSGITFVIGVQLLPSKSTYATWGELLRTTGFATGPGILGFLGIIPELTGFLAALLAIWILVAAVVAVKQALDYTSTLRALAVCIIGWLINLVLTWVVVSSPVGSA